MNWKNLLVALAVAAFGAGVFAVGLSTGPDTVLGKRAPIRKVVLVTIDTLRADRLSSYGYHRPTTPHIDAWARGSTLFERATVPAPWTAPSMASLISGRYPAETGVFTNRSALKSGLNSLGELFTEAGVKTAWFNTNPVLMLQRPGFRTGFQDVAPSGKLPAKMPYSKLEPSVFEWLDENSNEDFFLWIHNMDPHSPPTEGNPYHQQKEWKAYDGEVRLVDDSMQRLLKKLESLGLSDEVLLVFTADHGEAFSEHQLPGHQNVIYDEVLHVPLIVRYPGMGNGGRISEPVELVDVYQTIVDLAQLPSVPGVRGESLVPLIEGRAKARTNEFSYHSRYYMGHIEQHHLAIRDRRYKLIVKVPYDAKGAKPGALLRQKPDWSLDKPGTTLELYRYEDDPREKFNLIFSGAEPGVVDKLKNEILRWRDSVLGSSVGENQDRVIDEKTRETLRKLGYEAD